MWNLKSIPKQAFFYWGSPRMSFLRWMTLYSFRKLNPDWKILLYIPTMLSDQNNWANKMFDHEKVDFIDYTGKVKDLNIEIVEFDFSQLDICNYTNEVHKSDLLRYYLLHKYGGIYSDMDILWIQPLEKMLANKLNEDKTDYVYFGKCPGGLDDGHAIGFLLSSLNSPIYHDIYHQAHGKLSHRESNDYQIIGVDLLNSNFRGAYIDKQYKTIGYLDKDCVYSIDHDDREYLYDKLGLHLITENTIGIHWYGGSEYVRKLIHNVNHTNYLTYDNKGTLIYMLRKSFRK